MHQLVYGGAHIGHSEEDARRFKGATPGMEGAHARRPDARDGLGQPVSPGHQSAAAIIGHTDASVEGMNTHGCLEGPQGFLDEDEGGFEGQVELLDFDRRPVGHIQRPAGAALDRVPTGAADGPHAGNQNGQQAGCDCGDFSGHDSGHWAS